jgi:hypothetical protein
MKTKIGQISGLSNQLVEKDSLNGHFAGVQNICFDSQRIKAAPRAWFAFAQRAQGPPYHEWPLYKIHKRYKWLKRPLMRGGIDDYHRPFVFPLDGADKQFCGAC